MERQCQRQREGDYYLDCSKGVYFRALLLLTSYRIRHCEEKCQWMQMREENNMREVDECCWKSGEEEED